MSMRGFCFRPTRGARVEARDPRASGPGPVTPERSPEQPMRSGRYAVLVAAGIFLSRIAGLVRERIFSHYFGLSDAGDVFKAAFKIPNFLQNLFGEGVLSASFIPVYARLLAEKDDVAAKKVAGAVFSLLALLVSLLVLIGILSAPWLVNAIAPGFEAEKRVLLVRLVKIIFPGTGLLVLSAWCLGVLNSHRRFFLSYAAPLAWNAVMIAALLGFGRRLAPIPLAEATAWASVGGSALQFLVQLPTVLRLARGLDLRLRLRSVHVRRIVGNFGPVFLSRGVVQVSAYVDNLLASFLSTGAVTALYNAQTIYLLPVGLFGMSVSAAELPIMSGTVGTTAEIHAALRDRLDAGLRRIAYFVVPSSMAFLALGDVVTGVIYQTGRFGRADSLYVWGILAGASVGLLATTSGRLYASAFYSLGDTRTPLRFAIVRVVLTTLLGYLAAFPLPLWIGIAPRWGVAGLTASAGVAGWTEFVLLRRALGRRIGKVALSTGNLAPLWAAAAAGALVAWGVKLAFARRVPLAMGLLALLLYGVSYLIVTYLWRVPEARSLVARVARRTRRGI
jgi:putative peptidoglycan lipid II flippase